MAYQLSLFQDNLEYDAFVEKFQPKKTTDDCYTPPAVYEAIRDWACKEYGKDPASVIRPFYPGGDYEAEEYPDGCFVCDNPPFSLLAQIKEFYVRRKISFFLFAPTLTCLSGRHVLELTHLITAADIVYENGAVVPTSFVTNCGGDVVAKSAPELSRIIKEAVDKTKVSKELPKYVYPPHVVTADMIQTYCRRRVDFEVRRNDCIKISHLESQKRQGKGIFGGGLLLSDRAAADRAAADRAAALEWPLSEGEREIIASLGSSSHNKV